MPATTPTLLPSWNDGPAKEAILGFVRRVTTDDSPDFVPTHERIAVFDNDGTLWCEMPAPVQAFFASDRIKALAPEHPEWRTTEPFKSQLAGDVKGVMAQGIKGVAEIAMATHAGMTTDATFIVSGGGVEFMRVFAEDVYGVPPENVIGSTIKTHFEMRNGKPVLQRDAALDFFDDKTGKPVAINKYIGRRPILCVGNSDGDREMLMWTTLGRPDGRPSLGVIVHHTDGEREFAYDRQRVLSGQLDQGLDEAPQYGWVLADMKADWKTVFPA